MTQAIEAYRGITVTPEFKELERLRELARHNEASALRHARLKAFQEAETAINAKWQGVIADKDAAIASVISDKDAEIARLRALLADK